MATRIFQDPDKWDDSWHIELPAEGKLLLDYLHCSCDRAGFLKWSALIASFKTGIPIDRVGEILALLVDTSDIDGFRLYFRKGIIYLHDHIRVQDPSGLRVTDTAHGGTLKLLFGQVELFPECLVHFPDTHQSMKKTIETYIEQGGAKNKENAMKSLLRELNRVAPAKLVPPGGQKQAELFKKDTPPMIKECLRLLTTVPGYPFDFEKDRNFLIDMFSDYGGDGFLFALKGKITWWIDEPIKASSKPRSQLRNWFNNHFVKFPAANLKKESDKQDKSTRAVQALDREITAKANKEKSKEQKEREEIKRENEWLDNHIQLKDIKAVAKRLKSDIKIAVDFMNQRRKAKGLKPLPKNTGEQLKKEGSSERNKN